MHQYILGLTELTTKKRTLCETVAEVQSIRDSLTKYACSKLTALLYATSPGCNAHAVIVTVTTEQVKNGMVDACQTNNSGRELVPSPLWALRSYP